MTMVPLVKRKIFDREKKIPVFFSRRIKTKMTYNVGFREIFENVR